MNTEFLKNTEIAEETQSFTEFFLGKGVCSYFPFSSCGERASVPLSLSRSRSATRPHSSFSPWPWSDSRSAVGRLSAVCGCSIAAGAGAAAGIVYLLGGTLHHIAGAIKNLTEDLAGVICDGAKAGCSLKLATAAGTAVQAALFALHGVQVHYTNGIIEASPEKTMQNIGMISTEGMIHTERTILQIMMEKQFSGI